MTHKTFISYKYSEARDLRDAILEALGGDAIYYQGETADSPDLTDNATSTIKQNLSNMMYGTSVTIVVLSPKMMRSKWINWEIEYCLKEITRKDRTSKTNGLVGVVQAVNGDYSWLVRSESRADGCQVRYIKSHVLYPIIYENRFNLHGKAYSCSHCKTYDRLSASYFSILDENEFLANPSIVIENAFEKSEKSHEFKLVKQPR